MNLTKYKRKFYPFAFIVILLSLLLLLPEARDVHKGRVKSVIDGDTIELYDGRIVRYIGVDAPRMKQQQEGRWIFSPQPYSVEARDFNEQLVLNKNIRLEFDTQEKDNYGRVLAYCFIKEKEGENFINAKIIEKGFGYLLVVLPNIRHIDLLVQAQKRAQEQDRGLWFDQKPIHPKRAKNHIGERKIVEGKVVAVSETRRSLELKFHRRRKSYLKLVIFNNCINNFTSRKIDPKQHYLNKHVRTFGFINEYSGPEIAVAHPLQIEILDEAATRSK